MFKKNAIKVDQEHDCRNI